MQMETKLKKSFPDKKPKTRINIDRFLITVNVIGSCGPLRLIVSEKDRVSGVIDAALRLYAREGRLPALGSDINGFLLYPASAGFNGDSPYTHF